MKSRIAHFPIVFHVLAATVLLALAGSVHAGLTFQMNLIHDCYGQAYTLAPNLYLNTNGGDSTPITYDQITSPTGAFTGGVGTDSQNNRSNFVDFNSLMQAVTNGTWQMVINVGDASQHSYTFTVSSTLTSNKFVNAVVDYPPDGATNVIPLPTFAWHGPTNADTLTVYVYSYPDFFQFGSTTVFDTNTTIPPALADGEYSLNINYEANVSTLLMATTPKDGSGNSPTNLNSLALFDISSQAGFTVVPPVSTASGHTNIAHYTFDNSGALDADSSGNGYNLNDVQWGPIHTFSTDAEVGGGAVQFVGTSDMFTEANSPVFPAWTNTFAGSFSVSVWINTTHTVGNDGDDLTYYNGQDVIDADTAGPGTIPVGLTGSKVAFLTSDTNGNADTLHSQQSVTTGSYVHIVSTRDQTTGQKCIYINGQLDNSNYSSLELLAGETSGNIGGDWGYSGYTGLVDDVQIYSGVLLAADVSNLYANPGTVLSNVIGNATTPAALAAAVDATNLTWSTSGDALWFAETTNTYSTNAAAAQSGNLQDDQSSVLQATVTGPGTISFYWQTVACNNDDFEILFYIDGVQYDNINGQDPWSQDTFTISGSGTHTLVWNANTLQDFGNMPTDAGYVDQVVFTSGAAPVITLNPFNQTNYPGYKVALLAAATGVPAPTWQWYEVSNSNPISIPGATSALFIPTNSGTNTVAGSYYAVASNASGSQQTTTALVTFVSAPVPPGWTEAFDSPLMGYDSGTFSTPTNDTFNVYRSCLVDSTGTNIYASGYAAATNTFGANTYANSNGENMAIIVKQTAVGTGLWIAAVTNNGNGNSYAEGLAPAPGGGVYATGFFSGTNWLGNTLLKDAGEGTVFLAKFDTNGNTIWLQTISNSFPIVNGVVADPSGNVTVAGIANSSTTVGSSNLTVAGQTAFLAQYSSAGTLNWLETASSPIYYLQYSAGRLYISMINDFGGATNDSVGGLTNGTTCNSAIAALNATNGKAIWLHGVGEALGMNPPGVIDDIPAIAISGTNVFLVGTAYGSSAVFGSITVPITDGRGQYFARYDTNGNAQLATGFGSATTQPAAAVADAAGNVYVAGNFDTYAEFGGDILAAPPEDTLGNGDFSQAFAAMFDRTGTPHWAAMATSTTQNVFGTDLINFQDIALAPNGVWVCGEGNCAVFFGTILVNSGGQVVASDDSQLIQPYNDGMLGMITLAEPALPVTLLNPMLVGTNLQFSFVSRADHTNYVQYSTNLANTNWLPYITIIGDGTTKTVVVPANTPKQKFFRVDSQ